MLPLAVGGSVCKDPCIITVYKKSIEEDYTFYYVFLFFSCTHCNASGSVYGYEVLSYLSLLERVQTEE